jgi:hypothetical protein
MGGWFTADWQAANDGSPMPQNQDTYGDHAFEFRHRSPAALEYLIVSKIVLLGYPHVSDGAKISYWVIYSHDWVEQASGLRKGYVYPSLKRLATLRHTTERTIRRHLAELIGAALITRELRPGKPSVLYIEEPTGPEAENYLALRHQREDKNVRPPRTKMSAPYKNDKDKQEKLVNGIEKQVMEEGARRSASSLQPMSQLLRARKAPEVADRTTWLVEEMVAQTGDPENSACYRVAAERCSEAVIFEALALLKDARPDGQIRNRGAWFVSTLKRLCLERHHPDPFGNRADARAGP